MSFIDTSTYCINIYDKFDATIFMLDLYSAQQSHLSYYFAIIHVHVFCVLLMDNIEHVHTCDTSY